ncbi:hypothetical protein [Aeromicrobium sp. UC242_57]|uniref:hypothetical protein n=1 Tax=Aeromicrobium sp. UC242_57 TaxID=3374624 RepID=UPI0037B59270
MAAALISGLSVNAADAASQSATLSMPRAINENVRFGVAGFVTPIQAGRPVELQVKSGKRWKRSPPPARPSTAG